MASRRKNESLESWRERMRTASQKRRDKRTPEQKKIENEKARINSEKRRAKMTPEDKRKKAEYERKRRNKSFTVYKHILGDKIYIGSGNLSRPKDFSNRHINWLIHFTENPEVEIIKSGLTERSAKFLEHCLINIYGKENLVNQNRAFDISTYFDEKWFKKYHLNDENNQ